MRAAASRNFVGKLRARKAAGGRKGTMMKEGHAYECRMRSDVSICSGEQLEIEWF
ncbi:MAG: hypothetical protein HN919_00495 [Verrucomicrobia bacterium]|nr:hypothetical protein [Verrucomicrobiota bacterium]